MRILTLMGKRTGSGFSLRCLSRSTWILIILGSRVQIPYPVRIKSEKQDLQHGFLIIILQYISTGATEQYCTAQKNVLPVLLSFISVFGSGLAIDSVSMRIQILLQHLIQFGSGSGCGSGSRTRFVDQNFTAKNLQLKKLILFIQHFKT